MQVALDTYLAEPVEVALGQMAVILYFQQLQLPVVVAVVVVYRLELQEVMAGLVAGLVGLALEQEPPDHHGKGITVAPPPAVVAVVPALSVVMVMAVMAALAYHLLSVEHLQRMVAEVLEPLILIQ